MTRNSAGLFWNATVAMGLGLALSACGGSELTVTSANLQGADENAVTLTGELSTSVPVGSTLQATADVNLRTGASTEYKVLHVVPRGSKLVTVERTAPQNGFYKVKHNGVVGWTHGGYYTLVGSPSSGGDLSARDAAIARAQTGVGFSYWWGHGRWLASGATSQNKGYCSGSCPNCSHSGSYGADCSGYVAKVWRVPGNNVDLSTDAHPYSTYNFNNETTHWSPISIGSLKKADAMVYRSGGAGHIFIYESGDGWGSMWAYEAKNCASGIVKNLRSATSGYKAIRRNGW